MTDAYAYCERLAREHYENFPVASRLLPPAMRPAIAAIYAFARTADDFADEPGRSPEERLRLLDRWQERLHLAAGHEGLRCTPDSNDGGPRHTPESNEEGQHGNPDDPDLRQTLERDDDRIFIALADTIERHRLPVAPFDDLLSAFRQDVTTRRYETWADVLDYCRRSANPVGRLVLRVAGYDDPRLDAWSDAVCTALQLTNFWQDLARDWENGRLYVPMDDVRHAGAQESDLDAHRVTPAWQAALAGVGRRTRALFERGRPVCDAVGGRLRWELRFTWLGGMRILSRVEAAGFDVFRHRPSLRVADLPALALGAVRWSRHR